MKKTSNYKYLLAIPLLLAGCSGDDDDDGTTTPDGGTVVVDSGVTNNDMDGGSNPTDPPATYTFESRFVSGESSVAHNGQTLRQVLMLDLNKRINDMTDRIDMGTFTPTTSDVLAELEFFFEFDGDSAGGESHNITTTPATQQTTYGDIGSANLVGKLAGNDATGQHKDWSTDFVGWDDPMVTTPESLVRLWFADLEALAIRRANGDIPTEPGGDPIEHVFVSEDGLDYKQLIQKFLGVGIAYSQGADDYLDDDTDGKGLLTDNTMADDGKPYSSLEHQWDEGFGYFGAAVNYADFDDDEIAAKGGRDGWSSGYHDTNGDGAIDLTAEFNFLHSVNAGKRDRGSVAATDFTKDAIDAFTMGRFIISSADGALDQAQMTALKAERDKALKAWEDAIGSTVVHYINEVLQDMEDFGTPEYSYSDHTKHWGELKGFALGFQFSRFSSMTDAQFAQFHQLVRSRPVLPGAADVDQYKADLRMARTLLGDAMGYDAQNLGDDVGENGW